MQRRRQRPRTRQRWTWTWMFAGLLLAGLAGTLPPARALAQGRPPSWRGAPPPAPPPTPPLAPPRAAPPAPPPRAPAAALPPGPGRLRNAAQGLCLDVAGWATRSAANVLLWECNGDPDQVWSFAATGELANAGNGLCLDAAGYDGSQGANVDVYRAEGLSDQRWTLVGRGPGVFELHNNQRGLCLDVSGRAGARGDNVLLWACDGGRDQLWSFEPYAAPPPGPPPPRPNPHRQYPPMQPELPVPVTPPPPPPAPPPAAPAPPYARRDPNARRPRPLGDDAFAALVQAVRNESFSESQLTVIEQASNRSFFRVAQLRALIDLVSFSATKLRTLELGAPRLVDPETAFALFDAFTFSGDKEQARQILKRNGI